MSDINYFELLSDADVVDAAVVGSTATKKSSGLYLSITEVFSSYLSFSARLSLYFENSSDFIKNNNSKGDNGHWMFYVSLVLLSLAVIVLDEVKVITVRTRCVGIFKIFCDIRPVVA